MSTLIIAEPGGTHDGKLDAMRRLVDLAADVGCDVFKSQWTSDPDAMVARRRAPEYLDAYRALAYPVEWHRDLGDHCHERGLAYACTAYLPQDVATLAPYVKYLKIASFEAADPRMHAALRPVSSRTIISTGMLDVQGVAALPSHWATLVCVSAYPTPDDQAALRVITNLRTIWPARRIGYSDHTRSFLTGALAVAAGAEIVEFHLRLDDCRRDNPDYVVARAPRAASTYVKLIRQAEVLMGDSGVKSVQPCESDMLNYRVR